VSELLRQIVDLKDAIQIVVVFAVAAFYLGFNWKTPEPVQPRVLVRQLEIGSCKAPDPNSIIFHDAAITLKEDMGQQKARVFVAESKELERYGRFVWIIERVPELSAYTLHVRSAYLEHRNGTANFYQPLTWRRGGERFSIDVPDSESMDTVAVLVGISSDISSTQDIPTDCTRVLQTTVGPPVR